MAGATGLELATFCVTGRRSNQTELRPQRCSCCICLINILNARFFVKQNLYPEGIFYLHNFENITYTITYHLDIPYGFLPF